MMLLSVERRVKGGVPGRLHQGSSRPHEPSTKATSLPRSWTWPCRRGSLPWVTHPRCFSEDNICMVVGTLSLAHGLP